MGYKNKHKAREYQKSIPIELKRIYQRTWRENNKEKKYLKNLAYRMKHGQKKHSEDIKD